MYIDWANAPDFEIGTKHSLVLAPYVVVLLLSMGELATNKNIISSALAIYYELSIRFKENLLFQGEWNTTL